MKYDFTTVHTRYGQGSAKWNEIETCLGSRPEDIVPFSVADMEFVLAPEIRNAIMDMVDNSVLGYANATDSYKEAVCGWMKRHHGWNIEKDWILPSHGIVDAFYNAVKCFTAEGEGVMLLTPVYYPMYRAIQNNKRVLVDCPLVEGDGRYEIDFDDFTRKAADPNTKMFILCSPHNPGGRDWSREEIKRLGEICMRNNVLVIADEIHFDLIMPGYEHTVYATLGPEFAESSIVMTAPSKTFNIAGLQTSNIIIQNKELREKFYQYMLSCNVNPKCNILGYVACEAAYRYCDEWLAECISVIAENAKRVKAFLAGNFPQIKVYDLQATYLLWMDFRGLGLSYKELERINHTEAKLYFDEGYMFGPQGEGFERWNLACPTAVIDAALARLKAAYDKYVK